MINCKDFDKIAARYDEYWHCENHDRPLLVITAPQEKRVPLPKRPDTLRECWLDTEYIVKRTRADLQNTCFSGEAYPFACPNLGPDVFGAYFGCGLEFGECTSWATNHVDALNKLDLSKLDKENFWWKKTVEITEAMAKDANGEYLVGITDIHSGLDGLTSLRGPEELCFDLFEEPELVEKLNFQLFDRFCEVYESLSAILAKYQKGLTNWMGVYHPEGWYVTSCDFQGMISEDMMKRFVLPEVKMELDYLKHSIFHLDGVGALRHLDCLLEQKNLNGVQWVYGAGKPGATHWFDVLKKIQNAGKAIHLAAEPRDLPELLETLPPEGILYNISCRSAEESEALIKMADNARKKKIF